MNLDFLSGIGDAIGSFFATPIVQLGLKAIGIYIVIVWLAAAFWAFRDMQLRTANPIVPYLAAAFVIGFTPVLFLFAVLVYKIIRPQERLGEAYERGLAEEALLAEIDAIEHCPTCNRLVGFEWSLCAWCGRDFERPIGAVGPVRTPAPRSEDVPAPAPVPMPAAQVRARRTTRSAAAATVPSPTPRP